LRPIYFFISIEEMTRDRRPPTLALWVLDRLGFARGNAPLVGDLLEEFRSGRSAVWFWRQTLAVAARCAGRRMGLVRVYWLALAAGFAAQLPVSLLLFRLHVPPPVHGLGWKFAAFVLLFLSVTLVQPLARRVFGKTSKDLRVIPVQTGTGVFEGRSALVGATAFETFVCILLLYCTCCVLASTAAFSSDSDVAVAELIWLGIGEGTSEWILGASRRREASEAAREAAEEREWETRMWPQVYHLSVSVICSDGTAILLDFDTCMETIFASANEELITALFKGGTSREQIRRAIWLASSADWGWPKPNPISGLAPVPVSKFVRLLGPGTDGERMMRYLGIPPHEPFLKRIVRRLVRGDR
jgi:hypothetical protein